ncbi:dispanin subfamily A member 2b-like [Hemitrygon akajei]|uniref:dispanin subfamily A member 2b-like n=1 Tax=Hemitrygon akajei TaxID=2704970 RepID=UPI003BF9B473
MSYPTQPASGKPPEYTQDAKTNLPTQVSLAPGIPMAPAPGILMAPAPGIPMAPAPGMNMTPAPNICVQRTQSRDFLVWSIFNMFYMNILCLGFIAVAFSVKARDRRLFGDLDGVKHYGNTAKYLNIAATVLTLLLCLLMIILAFLGVFSVRHYYG